MGKDKCIILILYMLRDHPFISTCLSVCEVILAESLPQQPVLSEGPQLGADLAQADQVPAVRQTLHDVQLQTGRQVSQRHACRCGLKETGGRKGHEYNRNVCVGPFWIPYIFHPMRSFVSLHFGQMLTLLIWMLSSCCCHCMMFSMRRTQVLMFPTRTDLPMSWTRPHSET